MMSQDTIGVLATVGLFCGLVIGMIVVLDRERLWYRLRGRSPWFQGHFCVACDGLLPAHPGPGDVCPHCGHAAKQEMSLSLYGVCRTQSARWHYRLGWKTRLERRTP